MIGIQLGVQDATAAIRPAKSSTVYNSMQLAANLMMKTCEKVAVLTQVVLWVSLSVCAMLLGVPFTLAIAEDRRPGRFLALSMPGDLSVGTQFFLGHVITFFPRIVAKMSKTLALPGTFSCLDSCSFSKRWDSAEPNSIVYGAEQLSQSQFASTAYTTVASGGPGTPSTLSRYV